MPILASPAAGAAIISPDGRYRYRLDRHLGEGGIVLVVMLNPSTADAVVDDPTVRRCMGFTRTWGYGHLIVANLYSHRATRPADLHRAEDPIGPACDHYLAQAADQAQLVVGAWGNHAKPGRVTAVRELLGDRIHGLAWNITGHPRHPLYVPSTTTPTPWPDPGHTARPDPQLHQ